MSLSMYLSIHLSIDLSIYLSVYLSIYLVNYRSISLCVYLCIYSSVKFSLHLSFDLPLDLSINLSSRHVDNKTMLLDFCWQHQKRSNSARRTVENIKNEAILRDFLQKWKVDCTADGLVPMRFAIFPCHVSKVLRLPRKN